MRSEVWQVDDKSFMHLIFDIHAHNAEEEIIFLTVIRGI
jgi:hypothetical protein